MDIFFQKTKKLFKDAFTGIINTHGIDNSILEAAFVAYAHKNPLIDFLFWRRVYVPYKYINKHNFKNILDFGTGSGILPYLISKNVDSVVATDIDYDPLEKIKKYVDFPSNISFIESNEISNDKYKKSFDCIIALDVLEHIEDITEVINLFKRVLKEDGCVVVSGPTENILYKIGRYIAGKEFSGDYHVSNIQKIKNQFSQCAEVKTISKLFPFFPLFDIFAVKFKK